MNRRSALTVSAAISLALGLLNGTATGTARAAEIKLLCSLSLRPAIVALIPDFEKMSGHKVTITYGTVGAVADRIQKGETADIAISSGSLTDQLQSQGKLAAGSRVNIAKVGVGVFVRKGSAKPDLASVDGFKRTLLSAKSIAYVDPASGAASSIYMVSLLERLGITAEMKQKTILSRPGVAWYASVATGEADMGFIQISDILDEPSVELAGPLPPEIQNYTQFAAGIVIGSSQIEAAKALVTFLSSPSAQTVLKSKGLE